MRAIRGYSVGHRRNLMRRPFVDGFVQLRSTRGLPVDCDVVSFTHSHVYDLKLGSVAGPHLQPASRRARR
jgi:hypothetical protein